ncbi:hypothetical protein [Streptomyces sp. NPDC102264]|uniref:hypothetical protein n=1 Tax=Streptomyces sp. NPDC102264 TaxID=3366149 RepID=UPI0037FC7B1E
MTVRKAAGVFAGAIALTVLGATNAVAADYKMTTLGHFITPGGTLEFTKNGDIVKVCDTDADGMAAEATVFNTSGSQRYAFHAGGKGTCVTKRASMGGVYDLPEGGTHQFYVCLDGGYCNEEKWKNNG